MPDKINDYSDDKSGGLFGHILDAAIAFVQEVDLLLEALDFEFGVAGFELARGHTALEVFELADLAVDGLDVGEGAADPTNGDVGHLDGLGGRFDEVLELLLCADEEDFLAALDEVGNLGEELLESFDGFVEVNEVVVSTFAVDIGSHLGVPATGFVAKVGASLEEGGHINRYGHMISFPTPGVSSGNRLPGDSLKLLLGYFSMELKKKQGDFIRVLTFWVKFGIIEGEPCLGYL